MQAIRLHCQICMFHLAHSCVDTLAYKRALVVMLVTMATPISRQIIRRLDRDNDVITQGDNQVCRAN